MKPPEGWVFRVRADRSESLGHFLGRFRRANELSHKVVANHLRVRETWVQDWENRSRRRNPTELQLIALSRLVEVDPKQLAKMLPPDRLHLQTRLCAACYAETPVHRTVWQRSGKSICHRHWLRLLSACPVCETGFRTPTLWDDERCEDCGLLFSQMRLYQPSRSPQRPPTGLSQSRNAKQ